MYKLIALGAGWLVALGLAVTLYRVDKLATIAATAANGTIRVCQGQLDGFAAKAAANAPKAKATREAAASTASKHNKAADTELATRASVPDDTCKSAEERAKRWLEKR